METATVAGRADWLAKADEVAATLKSTLWRPELKACFDKDVEGQWVTTLVHNNLRMCVFNSCTRVVNCLPFLLVVLCLRLT